VLYLDAQCGVPICNTADRLSASISALRVPMFEWMHKIAALYPDFIALVTYVDMKRLSFVLKEHDVFPGFLERFGCTETLIICAAAPDNLGLDLAWQR